MDFKYHLEITWKIFTQNLPALLINTLLLFIVSIGSLGIMMPVATAGYTHSLLLALRQQKKPVAADLFSFMNLFFPLFGFSILIGIVLFLGIVTLILPGLIIGGLLTFFCMYMLPLMTDQNLGITEAIRESSRMAMEEPVTEHLVVVALYIGLISLGSSVWIGGLLTQPFATLFVLSVFEAKRKKALPGPDISSQPPPPPPHSEN
jgi:uncharacterized membrane protein